MKKVNQIRKQNWSAPAIFSVFISICMIIIFSFETLGLTNKEKNLEFRYTTPEIIIKSAAPVSNTPLIIRENTDSEQLIEKIVVASERNREDKLENMMNMLLDGVILEENEIEFYDI